MAKSRKATWLEKEMVYDAIRNSREPLDINLETCTFKRSGAGNILCLQNGQQVFYVDKKGQLVLPEKKKTAAEKRAIKKEKEEARKIQKEKKEAKKEKEERQKQHWMEVIEKESEKLENGVLGFDIFPVFDRKTGGSIRMSIVIQPKFSNIGAISPLQIPAQKWTDDLIHTKILWATQAYYDVFLNNENERSIRNAVIKYIEGNAGLALDSSLTDLVMYSEFFKQVKLIQRNSLLHKSKLTLSGVKLQPNGLVRFNVSGVTFISDVDGSNLVCKKESTLENIVTFANAHKNVIKTCLYLASEINKRSSLGFSVNLSFTIDVQNRALDAVMLFGDGSAAAKMSFSELELTADKVKAWAESVLAHHEDDVEHQKEEEKEKLYGIPLYGDLLALAILKLIRKNDSKLPPKTIADSLCGNKNTGKLNKIPECGCFMLTSNDEVLNMIEQLMACGLAESCKIGKQRVLKLTDKGKEFIKLPYKKMHMANIVGYDRYTDMDWAEYLKSCAEEERWAVVHDQISVLEHKNVFMLHPDKMSEMLKKAPCTWIDYADMMYDLEIGKNKEYWKRVRECMPGKIS